MHQLGHCPLKKLKQWILLTFKSMPQYFLEFWSTGDYLSFSMNFANISLNFVSWGLRWCSKRARPWTAYKIKQKIIQSSKIHFRMVPNFWFEPVYQKPRLMGWHLLQKKFVHVHDIFWLNERDLRINDQTSLSHGTLGFMGVVKGVSKHALRWKFSSYLIQKH